MVQTVVAVQSDKEKQNKLKQGIELKIKESGETINPIDKEFESVIVKSNNGKILDQFALYHHLYERDEDELEVAILTDDGKFKEWVNQDLIV